MPDIWTDPYDSTKTFPTGASPTPRSQLLAARPFVPPRGLLAAPDRIAYVPKYRSNFGNDRYGDCVTAEEAFAKTCVNPELFNNQSALDQLEVLVIAWARSHGVLNGASLYEVLDWMAKKGFQISAAQLLNDGPKLGVDYEDETVLQAAIFQGPVKLAIGAGALPSGAGSRDGHYALTLSRNYSSDHSTTLCGYGPAEWLFEQLSLPCPTPCAGLRGYLHYTWSTIGFFTHTWVVKASDEAWLRTPTTIGLPPLPVPPIPPIPPTPGPIPPPYVQTFDIPRAGRYALVDVPS